MSKETEQVIELGIQKIDEQREELRRLKTCMAAIVDCYGLGQMHHKFVEQAHPFIIQGRELVKDFKRA